MIYLDTSAAMKLVRAESLSADLSDWLRHHGSLPVVSSVLVEIELIRATRRVAPDLVDRAEQVLRGIDTVTLSPSIVHRAAAYPHPLLRSLDAIHLASAEHVSSATASPLRAFVAYDDRLLEAARGLGLPTVAPGVG